jgi:hypothetical protein
LEIEIAHMNGEPFGELPGKFGINTLREDGVELPYRLAHCRTNRSWRELAKLSQEGDVINGFVW